MDQENVDYLKSLGERASYYYEVRKKAVKFIIDNKIKEKDLSVHVILMSAIWAGAQRNEDITEEDLYILFGLKNDENDEPPSQNVMRLHPDQQHLTLQEILELTVERFK